MDAEDRARHIDGVAQARAALRQNQSVHATETDADRDTPPVRLDQEWSTGAIAAQMASGAQRDALEARVAELELEVRQLRAVLARIAHEVASAIAGGET